MFQSVNAWEKWKTNIRTKIKCCNHLEICVGDGSFFFFFLYTKPLIISQVKNVIVFWKLIFEKLFFKSFCVCLLLKKLINRKYFPVNEKYFSVKGKFDLIYRKLFSFYFGRKTLSGSCEKFRNVILFVDYIKFDSQTFNC